MIFKKWTRQWLLLLSVSYLGIKHTAWLTFFYAVCAPLFFQLYDWFHYQQITFNSYEILCNSLAEVKVLTFSLFSLSSPPSCMDLNLLISSLHLSLHAILPLFSFFPTQSMFVTPLLLNSSPPLSPGPKMEGVPSPEPPGSGEEPRGAHWHPGTPWRVVTTSQAERVWFSCSLFWPDSGTAQWCL